ncbi:MAG: hypothetical protein HY902_10550, partial [Deltaproteobacteria bacterium]|nr:hypothetical protein [Deltaproteobacteria bacterium]
MSRSPLWLALLAACIAATAAAEPAGSQDAPAAQQQDPRLAEAAALMQQASQLIAGGRYADAKAAAQQAIDRIQAVLGRNAPQLAEPMSLLGDA